MNNQLNREVDNLWIVMMKMQKFMMMMETRGQQLDRQAEFRLKVCQVYPELHTLEINQCRLLVTIFN